MQLAFVFWIKGIQLSLFLIIVEVKFNCMSWLVGALSPVTELVTEDYIRAIKCMICVYTVTC